jgi:NAD(P)-dependent dehydrogenase (short-subunit alcohol dehydrogenase family)
MAQVVLITGTSTGIGLATSVVLAQAGFRVVATMRNLAKATALRERAAREGVELDLRQLDVVDQASVDTCVSSVIRDHGPIDILVNNAGAGYRGTLEHTPIVAAQRAMDLNYFGVWRVSQAVLPAMRERRAGRIITVSSLGGVIGTPFNEVYCAAKFAVEGLIESAAPAARVLGIHMSLIEPGPVATEFANTASPPAEEGSLPASGPYAEMFQAYRQGFGQATSTPQTGDDVAQTILAAATDAKPHLRYQTSELARALAGRKVVDPSGDAYLELMVGMMSAQAKP